MSVLHLVRCFRCHESFLLRPEDDGLECKGCGHVLSQRRRRNINPSAFGAAIRFLRQQRGWSQDTLSSRIGSTRGVIACFETGRNRNPYADTVQRLQDALQLRPYDREALILRLAADNPDLPSAMILRDLERIARLPRPKPTPELAADRWERWDIMPDPETFTRTVPCKTT